MVDQRVMAEATRLTREGRLAEATALLRGREAPPAPGPRQRGRPSGAKRPGLAETLRGLAARRGPAPRPAVSVPAGARWSRHTARAGSEAREFALFVPSRPRPRPDLVLMLHGCTQGADDFAVGTRTNAHAERHGFLVAYPEQDRGANRNGCWNWFEPGHKGADSGELAVFGAVVDEAGVQAGLPAGRAFAAGMSAGGAAAANLAAAMPERLSGVMVHSGLPAGSAAGLPAALQAMAHGAGTALENRLPVPMLVVHGDADRTVAPANADGLVRQALGPARATITEEEAGTAGGKRFRRTREVLPDGTVLCERLDVAGGGHAWFGGDAAGSHTDPGGVDASAETVRFFGLDRSS